MTRPVKIVIYLIIVFLVVGCEEEAPEELLTEIMASFRGDFLSPEADEGYLFYSDLDGELLAGQVWSNNSDVTTFYTDGYPDRMSMTTIQEYFFNAGNTWRVDLVSNIGVKSDAYIWQGGGANYRWREPKGNVVFNFVNTPETYRTVLSTAFASLRRNYGSAGQSIETTIYAEPTAAYVAIFPDNDAPAYVWIENIQVGDTVDIDYASAVELTATEISVETSDFDQSLYIYGFGDSYYDGYYRVETFYPYMIEGNSVIAYIPEGLFANYRTAYYVDEESYPTANGWYGNWMGTVPGSVDAGNIDFVFIADSEHDVTIEIDGEYTQIFSQWTWMDNEHQVQWMWTAYTDLQSVNLPRLPEELLEAYPNFSKDSLKLMSTGVSYVDGLTYDEYIERFFQSGEGFYDLFDQAAQRRKDPAGLRP